VLLRLQYSYNTPGVCPFSSFPVPCSLGLLCTSNAYKVILFLWRFWFSQVMGLFYPNFCYQHVFHCIMRAPMFCYCINFHNFALIMYFFFTWYFFLNLTCVVYSYISPFHAWSTLCLIDTTIFQHAKPLRFFFLLKQIDTSPLQEIRLALNLTHSVRVLTQNQP